MADAKRSLSIVVPVHNEAGIVRDQLLSMLSEIRALGCHYELLVVENGSSDATPEICLALAESHPEIRVISLAAGDYGIALRTGILSARNDTVIIFNVEFWSAEFVAIALVALRSRAIVIGSKAAPGATDDRPAFRRLITKGYNLCLRIVWGFGGTDTHGMKAFDRVTVAAIAKSCQCTGFVFDTELVLRCERAGLRRLELPTDVREIRAPGPQALVRRIPGVLRNMWKLWRTFPR